MKDIWIGIENVKQNEIRNISKDFKDIIMCIDVTKGPWHHRFLQELNVSVVICFSS